MKQDTIETTCKKKVKTVATKIFGSSDSFYVDILPKILFVTILVAWLIAYYFISKHFMHKQANPMLYAVACLVVGGSGIFAYFYLYLKQFEECAVLADPMNRKLFSVFGFPISMWPLSHFILYLFVSIASPSRWKLYLTVGVAWEGIEYLMKSYGKETVLSRAARTRVNESQYNYLTYWESAWEDIVINSMGVLMGVAVSKVLPYDAYGMLKI